MDSQKLMDKAKVGVLLDARGRSQPIVLGIERQRMNGEYFMCHPLGYIHNASLGVVVFRQTLHTYRTYSPLSYDIGKVDDNFDFVTDDKLRKVTSGGLMGLVEREAAVRVSTRLKTDDGKETDLCIVGRFYGMSKEKIGGKDRYFACLGYLPQAEVTTPFLQNMKLPDKLRQRRNQKRKELDSIYSYPVNPTPGNFQIEEIVSDLLHKN